jgi:hypothetical protein
MKTKLSDQIQRQAGAGRTFKKACATSCAKVLAQLKETKAAILAESRDTLKVHEQLLKLALNEAEALAWQTVYPHLVFPALAAEKVQGASAWHEKQRSIRRTRPSISV